jgi:hypothetical protein
MSAQVLAGIGNGLFVLAMLAVALRLLLLWRRSRAAPELLVGLGFVAVAALGFPLMVAGGVGRLPVGELSLPLVGLGVLVIALGLAALMAFTWRVFAPDRSWAAALAGASFAAAFVLAVGSVRTLAAAPEELDAVVAGSAWWMALRGAFEIWYAWTAIASLAEYARARRRLAVGLSDPVVVNRFLLWGLMGAFQAANGVVAVALEAQGLSPMRDPVPALVLAANGLAAGGLMLMTFMPPRGYLDLVRRHAAAAAGG